MGCCGHKTLIRTPPVKQKVSLTTKIYNAPIKLSPKIIKPKSIDKNRA